MEITIINKEWEIINASRLSIKVINNCLVGINEKQETIVIERYESEERAKEILKRIGERTKRRYETGEANYMIIDLYNIEKEGSEKKC